MDTNPLADQVADALKGLINASVNSIKEGNLANARAFLDQALSITEMMGYHAGTAMVLHNYANLHIVAGDKAAAMEAASLALEKARLTDGQSTAADIAPYEKLAQNISLTLQLDGAACVKNRDYRGALACFEAALPHAAAERKDMLVRQISLIKKVLDGR